MDKPVNRVRAKSPAANVAVPVPAPARPSSLIAVENEDPFDRFTHAKIAQLAGGFSPMGLAEAAFDWALHLAASPGRRAALALSALSKQAAPAANECVIVERGLGRQRSQTRRGGRPPIRCRGMGPVAVFALCRRLSCRAAMVGRSHDADPRRSVWPGHQ